MANRNNNFVNFKDRVNKRSSSVRKVEKNTNDNENSFFAEVFPIFIVCSIIVCFGVFYFLFNNYKEVLVVEDEGYFIDTDTLVLGSKKTDRYSNLLEKVNVKENDIIYKNAINHYVDSTKDKTVNINYPFFVDNGLSFINYNDNINLINSDFERSTGYSGLLISYGRVFDFYTHTQIDEEKYLLLSYEDDVMINLYDMKVKTFTNEYIIPVNSFVYFEENNISYYERTSDGFKYNIIKDVDFESLISFSYESALEFFEYDYEKFLKGIDTIYIRDFVIEEEIEPDDPYEEIIPPSEDDDDEDEGGEVEKPEFVWEKPSVYVSDISASVYTLSGNIKIVDNAHVIVKEPTFTFYRNNKTFLRRTYYTSGEMNVKGLIPSTTFNLVGTYTYLAEDMETRIAVTFYRKELTTGSINSLDPISMSFANGKIFPKKIELNDVKVVGDLENEALIGVSKIELIVGEKNFFLSSGQVSDITSGRDTLVESPESLDSSSQIDYNFKLLDREGNQLPTLNTTGTTRTSKRPPNFSLRVLNSEIDSVTVGINIKNEDDIEFTNYIYILKKSDGSIVEQKNVTGNEIVLTNLDPDQLFNITLYADYDIDDGNGVSNHQLGGMDFTSKPITTLGYVNLPMEIEKTSYDSIDVLYNINMRKTNAVLVKLLQKLRFDIYDEEGITLVDSVLVEGDDIENLKLGNQVGVTFNYLDSFTNYKVIVTSIIQQGSTVYEIGTTQGIEKFMTNKYPARVNITNPFTTETMIDFDISVEDIDNAIEATYVRLELRDKDQQIVNTKKIPINAEPERVTYNNLNTNEFYNIYVYADGYNETNLSSNYKSKYLMFNKSIYTESGISGKIQLISSLRTPTGPNIADVKSEVKWLQMYQDKNIPKTVDSEGNMHIYSKDGASAYTYDLNEYHGQIVTATFKVKAVVPLTSHKLYFTQYISGTTSGSYSKELTGLTTTDYKEFSYTFRVGSYSSLQAISKFDVDNAVIFTPVYPDSYGQNLTDAAGFYLSGGTSKMAEYVIKDFEIHLQYDMKEYELKEDLVLQQGSYKTASSMTSSIVDNELYIASSNTMFLEGGKRYTFYYDNDTNYDIYFYTFDEKGKNVKNFGWVNSEYSFYLATNRYVKVLFRYKDATGLIKPDAIKNFRVYTYERNESTGSPKYDYELVSKARINLSDKRDEITNNDYYIKIYEDDTEVKSYNFVELEDTLAITDVIKNIELEEHKEYTVELGIMIRDRYYGLSNFQTSTEDEVMGIADLAQWDKIQPYGNYILLNDLNFQNYTQRRIGVGYRYFHGVIDFQGYSMRQFTAKTDGTSNTNYYRIYRIETDAVLKNIVLDVQLNNQKLNDYVYGFVQYNYGTIENIVVNITDTKESQMPQRLLGLLTYQNGIKGRVRNFVVNISNDLHYYGGSALLVRENYGLIENGYIYGNDVTVDFNLTSGSNRELGLLTRYNGARSIIRHVFVNTSYNFMTENTYDVGGLLSYQNYGRIEDSYVVGDVNPKYLNQGPVILSAGGTSKLDNVYYFSDNIYTSKIQDKASFASLNDIDFQNNVLGNGFNIDEMVSLGFFPQVKFTSNKMPSQDYLELPAIEDSDYADIIHMEVIENKMDSAKVKVIAYNPLGEEITEIVIANLRTTIDSQSFADGKSTVMITVSNPSTYVSKYQVSSITSTSSNGYKSTRIYQNNELFLKVDMFRKIYTVQEFLNIKNMNNQNYMLMNDLDFSTYSNYNLSTFSGILDGQGYTIKNIKITNASYSGLISTMNGTLRNLNVENFYKTGKTSYHGLVGTSNKNGKFINVHIVNSVIDVTEEMTTDTMRIGALVGQATESSISYSSVTNFKVSSVSSASNLIIGGLIGRSSGAFMTNSFAQDIDFDIENSISTYGIGGLVGNENYGSQGFVESCYATGRIDTNSANVGGLIGNAQGYIKDSYSTVDIVSYMSFLGGLVGNSRQSTNVVDSSIYLGNLYTSSTDKYISRISSNYKSSGTNYTMSSNLINGLLSTLNTGEKVLDYKEFLKPETYDMIFETQNYDFSRSSEGILPKLYSADGETLLPNQKDNYLYVNMFNVDHLNMIKTAEYANVSLTLANPDEFIIESVKIEDSFTKVGKNVTENGVTQIEFELRPDKYYDSYRLSELTYIDENGDKQTIERNIKLDAIFYKSLKTFDDWQKVSSTHAENYTLDADIDFTNKPNIKTQVMFNRLEASGFDEQGNVITRSLKGLELNYDTAGHNHVLIQRLSTNMKNVVFENINITDNTTGAHNYVNLILYNYGTLENVTFRNVEISAPNKHYVAPVGRNYAYILKNVLSDSVTVNGKNYTSGFIAIAANTVNDRYEEIHGINLDISSTGEFVGGLFANLANVFNLTSNPMYLNMSVKDSTISTTYRYVGGIAGYGDCNYCVVDNVNVSGEQYVGGMIGVYRSAYHYNNSVYNSHVSASYRYAGGIYGQAPHVYNSNVYSTTVEGLRTDTYGIGGISGYSSTTFRGCGVLDSTIINKGEMSGGLIGLAQDNNAAFSYVTDTNIIAHNKAGGGIGQLNRNGRLEVFRVSNSNVVANEYYAGSFVGYYNNTSDYGSYYEGYVAEDTAENVNVQANHYAGGIFGAVNSDIYYASRVRKLYFSGVVTTLSGLNAGIASGDRHNITLMRQPRVYIYNKSLVNGIEVSDDNVGEKEYSDIDLIENVTYLPGTVNGSGVATYDENDIKAIYSDFIEIQAGNTYVINVDYITRPDSYQIHLYKTDYTYITNITSSTVDSYLSSYHTVANYDNIMFTAYRNFYIRVAITNKASIEKVTLKKVYLPVGIDKERLLDAGRIRESLTWVEQTSSTQNFNASLLNYARGNWKYTELQMTKFPVTVYDRSAKRIEASGYVGAISYDGAMFQANNKHEHYLKVNNYKFPNSKEFTVNAKFNNYSSRANAPIFTVMSTSAAKGFGVFSNSLQIMLLVGNKTYNTGYFIPYISDVDITVTYKNQTISLYIDGEHIKDVATVDIGDLSTYDSQIGYSYYYNNANVGHNFVGHIKNISVFDRVLDENEILSNYNSSGLTDTSGLSFYYDLTGEKVSLDANYMLVNYSSIRDQRTVPMPKFSDSYTQIPTLLNYSLNSPLLSNYVDVYSSGIDTVNVEFSDISKDLILKYRIGENEYQTKVDRKVYTLQYDYLSDFEIELVNSFEFKVLSYSPSDLAKKIRYFDKNYYYIDVDGNLYKNGNKIIENALHIYNNLVLLRNGKVYNLTNGNVQAMYSGSGILSYINSIRSSVLNGKTINTYYNYTVVDNAEMNGQMFIKDSHAYMFNSNDTRNDNIVYGLYNTEEYQIMLKKDGSLLSYKSAIKFPKSFVNKNISEITFDYENGANDNIVMVRYDSGNILVFNYVTGDEIYRDGQAMTASLFEYLSSSFSKQTYSLSNPSDEYKDSKNFIDSIKNLDENSLKSLDLITNSDNSTSNILDTEYISVYNSVTNKFDVYNVNELVTNDKNNNDNSSDDNSTGEDEVDKIVDYTDENKVINAKPLNSKVKSNFVLYDHFYGNKKDTFVADKKSLIYGSIIVIVIVNLFVLGYIYSKKENNYE